MTCFQQLSPSGGRGEEHPQFWEPQEDLGIPGPILDWTCESKHRWREKKAARCSLWRREGESDHQGDAGKQGTLTWTI